MDLFTDLLTDRCDTQTEKERVVSAWFFFVLTSIRINVRWKKNKRVYSCLGIVTLFYIYFTELVWRES